MLPRYSQGFSNDARVSTVANEALYRSQPLRRICPLRGRHAPCAYPAIRCAAVLDAAQRWPAAQHMRFACSPYWPADQPRQRMTSADPWDRVDSIDRFHRFHPRCHCQQPQHRSTRTAHSRASGCLIQGPGLALLPRRNDAISSQYVSLLSYRSPPRLLPRLNKDAIELANSSLESFEYRTALRQRRMTRNVRLCSQRTKLKMGMEVGINLPFRE
jgi:hypothetical protein